jgi:hypothetical protein
VLAVAVIGMFVLGACSGSEETRRPMLADAVQAGFTSIDGDDTVVLVLCDGRADSAQLGPYPFERMLSGRRSRIDPPDPVELEAAEGDGPVRFYPVPDDVDRSALQAEIAELSARDASFPDGLYVTFELSADAAVPEVAAQLPSGEWPSYPRVGTSTKPGQTQTRTVQELRRSCGATD